jgi:spore germination protein
MITIVHREKSSDLFMQLIFRYSLFLVIFLFAFPISTHAATKTQPVAYTRLFYYQDGTKARQSFLTHPGSIDIFAPQSYAFDDTGQLLGSIDPTLLVFAKKHQIKVMPLVTNDGFTKTAYQTILDNPLKQAAAINALITEAQSNGYWGWQIDFEQMDASYKDKFSAFVQKTYVVFKQNNLTLSVAVVSKVSDNPNGYPNNLWQKLIGVYDYSAIASSTDFVSVMSYDDPNSTGPVVEYSWLQKVLAYSLVHIPKEKVSLGIPLYYWQWSDASGKRVGIGGNTGIQNVLAKHNVGLHYSTTQQEPYLTYWSHARSFTIWYENAKSIGQKISLIKKNGLYGFSAWALGLELANVYSAVKE